MPDNCVALCNVDFIAALERRMANKDSNKRVATASYFGLKGHDTVIKVLVVTVVWVISSDEVLGVQTLDQDGATGSNTETFLSAGHRDDELFVFG